MLINNFRQAHKHLLRDSWQHFIDKKFEYHLIINYNNKE